jgi:hypothetical protein
LLAVNNFQSFVSKYLPAYPICADSKDEFKFQKKHPKKNAISQNRWLFFNDSFLNLLIFDLDYFLTEEEAWQLCIERIGFEPTWVAVTENGVHIAFALENMVKYEWKNTIQIAQRVKVAISDALDADSELPNP